VLPPRVPLPTFHRLHPHARFRRQSGYRCRAASLRPQAFSIILFALYRIFGTSLPMLPMSARAFSGQKAFMFR
jgi:hypothetical protein